MLRKWPSWWKICAGIGTIIVGIAGIISTYYSVNGRVRLGIMGFDTTRRSEQACQQVKGIVDYM